MKHLISRYFQITLLSVFISFTFNTAVAATKSTSPELIRQKLDLMERMISQSSRSEKINQGPDGLAKQQLQQAQDQMALAEQALKSGQTKLASKYIEQAMLFYATATGKVADATDKGDAQATRYKELSVSIESFRLYVDRAISKSHEPNPLDTENLQHLMQLATHLGNQKNYGAANEVLNEGYMMTIMAVSALKGGTTIVYSQDFDTPEEEYHYQLERYKSLQRLLKMVSPGDKLPSKYSWAQKPLESSREAYQESTKLAQRKAHKEALEVIGQASKKLTQVLRVLGLPIS
ncbi:MAG: hypothetical protein V7739_08455 [Motiliproteus sp.]